MKRIIILTIVAFMSVAMHGQLFNPLNLGDKQCERIGDFFQPQMHVEGNILYVCTNQGLYSKDLSNVDSTWRLAGFEGIPLQDYVRRGDEILALRYNYNYNVDGGFFLLSHDGGKTYEDVTPDLFSEQHIWKNVLTRLVQHPSDPNTLLVASVPMGLFQSFDFGQTWNQLTDIIPSYIGYNPSDPKIIYGSGEDGFFAPVLNVSYDGGQTWKYLHPDFPGDNCMNRVAFHPTDPNRWIAGGGSAVYTSADNGQTWNIKNYLGDSMHEALWDFAAYDSENSDIVYMAGRLDNIKVMCSTNGGESWCIPQTGPTQETGIDYVNDFTQYGGKLLIYAVSDVYEISKAELLAQSSENTEHNYRPFIEEGKVWKVVRNHIPVPIPELNKDYWTIESHYFEGDTIVGGYPCKKMMEAHDVLSTGDHSEFYDGAIFEEGRRVYCAWPNNVSFFLLYDFASTEGSEVSFCDYEWGDPYYGQIQKSFRQDDKFHGWTTTFADVFLPDEDDYPFPVNLDWMEGVGYQGFYNFVKTDKAGYIRELLSCTVGDEVLYYDAELAAKMAPADPSEVKKNTIDFTHVVKSQPKAPERSLTPSPSPVREGSQEEETLTGEYSLKELFVNFKPLAGPYVITICDDSGTEVYRKEVQTSNVIGLNTDISGYEKGEYTITVENEEEAYTAEFKIDDETGINRPTPDPSLYGGEKAGAWYDLSGRKVSPTPAPSPVRAGKKLPRGVYIKDRRKVVVK